MEVKQMFHALYRAGKAEERRWLTPMEITRLVRHHLGTEDVRVLTKRCSEMPHNAISACGFYDPLADMSGEASIEIFLIFNERQKQMKLSKVHWRDVCTDLVGTIGHELVHQRQYRNRGFRLLKRSQLRLQLGDGVSDEDLEYYGHDDEIEAYGFNIACEAFLRRRVKTLRLREIKDQSNYQQYVELFGARHPATKQLVEYAKRFHKALMKDG